MLRFLVVLFALLFTIAPAQATPVIDAAGAKHLESVVTTALNRRAALMKAGHQALQREGPVSVEQAKGYYAITLPRLSVLHPDGSHTEIGIIAINAVPGTAPGTWAVTIAAPSPITEYDSQKNPVFRISLGKQNFSGIWDETLTNFAKINAEYHNVQATNLLQGLGVSIDKAGLSLDMTPDPDGKTWSGPAQMTLHNIVARNQGKTETARIGSLVIGASLRKFDPEKMNAYSEKMATLVDETAMKSGAIDPAGLRDAFTGLFDKATAAWAGIDCNINVKDITLTDPGTAGKQITLGSANASFGMDGVGTGAMRLNLGGGYTGLTEKPSQATFDNTVPQHFALNMTFDKLPMHALLQEIDKIAGAATPEDKHAAGLRAAKIIPQILTAAGSFVTLSRSGAGNGTYNIGADGRLNANAKTVMGADGKLHVTVEGLDKLFQAVQAGLKAPDTSTEEKLKLQKTMAALFVLQGFGQQGKAADGNPVRDYDLELTPGGKIMLNGTDMTMLQELMKARQQNAR